MAYIETTNQGNPNTLAEAWPVEITDGTNVLGTSAHPMEVAGTVTAANPSVSATGAAVPADATMAGATNPSGDLEPLSVDASGYLEVNVKAGSAGNSAASATGSAVPADADYIGYDNGSGNLTGVSSSTPLPVQEATLDATIVAQGTSASSKILIAGGKSNDATAQYRELPLGGSGRSVIVEGYAGGTAVPISGTVTTQVTQGTRQAVSFTSSTPADTSNTIALVAYANVAVTLHYSGTVTGGQMFFEVSDDNSNWYGITMAPTDNTQTGGAVINFPVDNYTLSSSAGNITWQMFVGGYAYFRVRMHIQVVGSGTAIVAVIPSTAACDPAPQVTQGITPWVTAGVAASGAAVTGNPVLVAGQDGTDARTLLTDNTGQLKVLVENGSAIAVSGTVTAEIEGHAGATLDGAAGSPSTQCVTVQGNSSGTAIPTTDSGLNVAQGSTTSGETGPLNQMATVTSAPTDTNAKTNPMRGDAAGNLRINPFGQTGSFANTLKGSATGAAGLTLTVPTGYKFIFKCCIVKIIIANSGSARAPSITFLDASSNYLAGNSAGFNQAINSTGYYTYGPSLPLSASLTATSNATIPLPEVCLPPGGIILFSILNGVAGDTIDVLGVNGIEIPD